MVLLSSTALYKHVLLEAILPNEFWDVLFWGPRVKNSRRDLLSTNVSEREGDGERQMITSTADRFLTVVCMATVSLTNVLKNFHIFSLTDLMSHDPPKTHFYTKKKQSERILERLMWHLCADNRDMWCVCVGVMCLSVSCWRRISCDVAVKPSLCLLYK